MIYDVSLIGKAAVNSHEVINGREQRLAFSEFFLNKGYKLRDRGEYRYLEKCLYPRIH